MVNRQMQVGDQLFDTRLDFFLCPIHGLLVPSRFSERWTTDDSCPVLDASGETCDGWLTPVNLDGLVGRLSKKQRELLILVLDDLPVGVPVLTEEQTAELAKAREVLAR